MGILSTLFNVSSAMASHGRMRRAIRDGEATNSRNRGIVDVGRVSAGRCMGAFDSSRDRIIVSGSKSERHSLVAAARSECLDRETPVVAIEFMAAGQPAQMPTRAYDPLFGYSAAEIGPFLDAFGRGEISRAGADFVRCIAELDWKSGLQPSSLSVARALESLEETFGRLAKLEDVGVLSEREADRMQAALMVEDGDLAPLRKLFEGLKAVSTPTCERFSIRSAMRSGDVAVGIPSAKSPELALACAEIEMLREEGAHFLLVVDGLDSECPKRLLEVLDYHRPWCLATDDAVRAAGVGKLPRLASLADGILILSGHSPVSSDEISGCLGDYEHVEVQVSRGGGGGFQGRVGYSRQATDSVTTTYRRERVIPSDAIRGLRSGEFVLVPSGTEEVFVGILA
ncbi:MAG: hypothetical protein IJ087_01155 [Eggerthellaceae bacterium]|nr:hypothetical protein [Eggerthellaceae bacterium]